MDRLLYKISAVTLLILFCLPVFANDKATDDAELLAELQRLHEAYGYIETASKTPQTLNQAPGIVTVITEEEILNSGARDLMDVLRLVPGFDFGVDLFNVVGPSMRSNWVYEGSLLLLIDGLEMNERRYGDVQIGQHYPIDHIQKIEVVRGPGSVMDGGFAKIGVINIITKNAKNKEGISLVGRYGQMQHSNGHRAVSFYGGQKLTEEGQITASGKISQAHRSDRDYTDIYGNSFNMANSSNLNDLYINTGLQYKNLALRFLFDDYKVENKDALIQIENRHVNTFKTYIADLKYQQELTDILKLNFRFNYTNQTSWAVQDFIDNKLQYTDALGIERYLGSIRLDYTPNQFLQMVGGVEFTNETFKNLAGIRDTLHVPGFEQYLTPYKNFTAYLESLLKTDWGNLTLGLRYDKHNTFESNLAPRAAFTDTIGNFHYKLLYSNSFRIPTIENYISSHHDNSLKPSRTKTYEIELGYQFDKSLSFITNAFFLSSKDIIVYGSLFNENPATYNANSKINTVGVETELRWKQDWGYVTLNHSYSQMLSSFKDYQPINTLTNSVVNSDMALGLPAHKFSLNSHIELTPSLSVNPSIIVSTSRYGYNSIDEKGNLLLQKYGPEVLGNIYFRYKNLFVKNLELGFGAYNIFGIHNQFIQPYNGGHAPLPDKSREFIFKVSYQL